MLCTCGNGLPWVWGSGLSTGGHVWVVSDTDSTGPVPLHTSTSWAKAQPRWLGCNVHVTFQCAHVPSRFSCVWLLVTLWTVACQAPLSIGFPRSEYCSGLPSPFPGVKPTSQPRDTSRRSPASAGRFFTSTTGEALRAPLCIQSKCTGDWGTQDGSPCREVPAPAYVTFTQNLYFFVLFIFILLLNIFFWPLSMWDLSSLTRGWTCVPYIGNMETLDHKGGPTKSFNWCYHPKLCFCLLVALSPTGLGGPWGKDFIPSVHLCTRTMHRIGHTTGCLEYSMKKQSFLKDYLA